MPGPVDGKQSDDQDSEKQSSDAAVGKVRRFGSFDLVKEELSVDPMPNVKQPTAHISPHDFRVGKIHFNHGHVVGSSVCQSTNISDSSAKTENIATFSQFAISC